MLPALREAHLQLKVCTLLVSPYRALQRDTERRLTASGIPWLKYKHEEQRCLDDIQPLPRVVLVSVEQLDVVFLRWLLLNNSVVKRIVIDEAHTLLDGYRNDMKMTLRLCQLGLPTVLMTATLPISMQHIILAQTRWSAGATRILRAASTVRKNLQFSVSVVSNLFEAYEFVQGLVVARVTAPLPQLGASVRRIIIFCLTKDDCESASTRFKDVLHPGEGFQVDWFHGGGDSAHDEHRASVQAWFSDCTSGVAEGPIRVKIVCCTIAFGVGIDLPPVELVIHLGGACSMLDYVQAVGRAGRDGALASCVWVSFPAAMRTINALRTSDVSERRDWDTLADIEQYARGASDPHAQCRVSILSRILDGSTASCSELQPLPLQVPSAVCDVCRRSHALQIASSLSAQGTFSSNVD